MSQSIPITPRLIVCASILLIATTSTRLLGQVTAPSVFTTSIMVQGEVAGTEFSDWAASGITVVDSDPVDNPGFLDIANIQVANDNDYLYLHATLHNATTISMVNIYLAFDTDQNTTTGFNILDLNEMGSEVGYQTDYPFAQHVLSYNLGLALTGGPVGNGGALIYPFWNGVNSPPAGIEMEWAVPLEAVIQFPPALGGPQPAFPNSSFNFAVYAPDTTEGLGDITQIISYTLATGPVGLPGDFDSDDDVDGRDFLVWQRNPAVGNLADWQANYGTGPIVAFVAVPEASSILMASMLVMILMLPRRGA